MSYLCKKVTLDGEVWGMCGCVRGCDTKAQVLIIASVRNIKS